MPDSEPSPEGNNPRNLPAVVQQGEVLRPPADNWLLRAIRTLFGWKAGSVRDDLKVVLDATTPEDVGFSVIERTMLRNILSLHERRIADVMVHRADIVAVKRDIPLGELMTLFESAAHSRLVVYNETLDDPEGMVHIRDLLAFVTARARVGDATKARRKKPFPAGLDLRAVDLALPLSEANITRKLLYVPPSMRAIDLLAQMQASRVHLALVVDEYGGTDGLVSIEDLVEQIVGDIEDEHDEQDAHTVVRQPDGSFLADARATLEDVIGTIGTEFDVGDAAEEVDTVGGYLVTRIGRVPVRGESCARSVSRYACRRSPCWLPGHGSVRRARRTWQRTRISARTTFQRSLPPAETCSPCGARRDSPAPCGRLQCRATAARRGTRSRRQPPPIATPSARPTAGPSRATASRRTTRSGARRRVT